MGKIVYLMGKSATGKDTIYRKLLYGQACPLKKIIPYTTRPIRMGESNGREYYFTDEAGFQKRKEDGKIIEHREYHTFHGIWRYFTADDGQIDLKSQDYVMIGTLESYLSVCKYFGANRIIPVMITLDDGVRLQRALNRELRQKTPKYEEMCRRFLADSSDFSPEKLQEAGITRVFQNDNLDQCLAEIERYIKEMW